MATEKKSSSQKEVNMFWLDSDSFIKRCFGVWFHYVVASLIIALAFFVIFGILGLVFGSMFHMFGDFDGDRGYRHYEDKMMQYERMMDNQESFQGDVQLEVENVELPQ